MGGAKQTKMRYYSIKLEPPYEFIVQKAIAKSDYKNLSQIVRWGLDLIKKELDLKIDTDNLDLDFIQEEPKKVDSEEWKLAGKLTTEQLTEYQEDYEPKKITIKEYIKIKDIKDILKDLDLL